MRATGVEELTANLRQDVLNSLQNGGLVSAFMCALASGIYSQPPEEARCFGPMGVEVSTALAWLSMGLYFIAICSSLILASDVYGVPDELLIQHLASSRALCKTRVTQTSAPHVMGEPSHSTRASHLLAPHTTMFPPAIADSVPMVTPGIGIFLMACAYGVDLGERNGCAWGYTVGLPTAPLFPLAVVLFMVYVRSRRKRLNLLPAPDGSPSGERYGMNLGQAYFTTWQDRVPVATSKPTKSSQ